MQQLAAAFGHLGEPFPLILLALGTALGILVGAVPGLTGAMLIALSLPLTFTMEPQDAMVLLVAMYVGSITGGLITATLLRIPGTPASMMTTLDGYPLSQQGQPGRALGLGVAASFVGGVVSWLFLITLSRPMADLSTKLGPFEMFALVMMALVLISSISQASLARGVLSGLLGILAAMPGASPATGEIRWTLGIAELNDGFRLLPVLIGLFAVSQVIDDIVHLHRKVERASLDRGGLVFSLADLRRHAGNMLRSSLLGTWIGILPGIGANIGSLVAYSTARNLSQEPDKFGQGSEEGIIASEAANNATVGGALIPLIALGIPGSVIDSILLGALVIHGLQPGPLLFKHNPEVVYIIMATALAASVVMLLVMWFAVGTIAQLTDVPRYLLIPAVLTFCVIGSYALGNRMFDVWVMLGFGLAGYLLQRLDIPLAPFVIGFVLAPLAEESLGAGLMSSGGSYLPLLQRPLAATFCIISLLLLCWPLVRRRWPSS